MNEIPHFRICQQGKKFKVQRKLIHDPSKNTYVFKDWYVRNTNFYSFLPETADRLVEVGDIVEVFKSKEQALRQLKNNYGTNFRLQPPEWIVV